MASVTFDADVQVFSSKVDHFVLSPAGSGQVFEVRLTCFKLAFLESSSYLILKVITYIYLFVCACMCKHTCEDRRTTCKNHFCPSTMWVPGVELVSQAQ